MNIEDLISQYIDGELSSEAEAELHHRLAVSPEARKLFRMQIELRRVARDQRVLQTPSRAMRAGLFERLQREEGMTYVPPVTPVAAAAIPRSIPSPVAAEPERRRRRAIVWLLPTMVASLLAVVIVWNSRDGSPSSQETAVKSSSEISARADTGNGINGVTGKDMAARSQSVPDEPSPLGNPSAPPQVASESAASSSRPVAPSYHFSPQSRGTISQREWRASTRRNVATEDATLADNGYGTNADGLDQMPHELKTGSDADLGSGLGARKAEGGKGLGEMSNSNSGGRSPEVAMANERYSDSPKRNRAANPVMPKDQRAEKTFEVESLSVQSQTQSQAQPKEKEKDLAAAAPPPPPPTEPQQTSLMGRGLKEDDIPEPTSSTPVEKPTDALQSIKTPDVVSKSPVSNGVMEANAPATVVPSGGTMSDDYKKMEGPKGKADTVESQTAPVQIANRDLKSGDAEAYETTTLRSSEPMRFFGSIQQTTQWSTSTGMPSIDGSVRGGFVLSGGENQLYGFIGVGGYRTVTADSVVERFTNGTASSSGTLADSTLTLENEVWGGIGYNRIVAVTEEFGLAPGAWVGYSAHYIRIGGETSLTYQPTRWMRFLLMPTFRYLIGRSSDSVSVSTVGDQTNGETHRQTLMLQRSSDVEFGVGFGFSFLW